ncbi:MAG: hypothetical protein A4S08_04895 [Proteobacteria bacterium SG_bin4]|nr:MAG: hypothetical protein A4S08_04895 [Proteobacteria bacterium SG_bin4]
MVQVINKLNYIMIKYFVVTKILFIAAIIQYSPIVLSEQQLDQNPKRFALLIGIKDYRPSDYVEDISRPVMLENLKTPCDDLEKIDAQLQKIGWRGRGEKDPEISVICDADAGTIWPKLAKLVDKFDSINDFLFIYIASHGVEINDRNYFFMRRAELDLKFESKKLRNDYKSLLFQGESFELNQHLYSNASEFYNGNIFIILDSCRDDPFVYTAMKSEFAIPVSAPQVNSRRRGIMLLYATTPGKRISDGIGSSYLVNSFVSELSKGGTVDKIVTNIVRNVSTDTRFTAYPQLPDSHGKLNNPDICFSDCTLKSDATSMRIDSDSQLIDKNAQSKYKNSAVVLANASKGSDVQPDKIIPQSNFNKDTSNLYNRKFTTVYSDTSDLTARSHAALTLDIFWCEGNDQEVREKDAYVLAGKIKQKVIENKDLSISTIRVRPLGSEENARPGYRLTNNTIRIDRGPGQEMLLAKKIKQISDTNPELQIQRIRTRSIGSMSVFICNGIPPFPPIPRMWLQASRDNQKGITSLIGQLVSDKIENIWVADAVEVVKNSPNLTQIRYFYKEDESLAKMVAEIVASKLGNLPLVVYMKGYQDDVEPGLLELWLGKLQDS